MTVDYTQQPPPQPPKKSSGCWFWGCIGCSAVIVLGGMFIAGIVFFVFGAIKASDVYRGAMHRVERDPRVIQAVGTPIETSVWISGNMNVSEGKGTADFDFAIHGPNGRGKVHVDATRESGNWIYNELTFTPSNGGPQIDLLKP